MHTGGATLRLRIGLVLLPALLSAAPELANVFHSAPRPGGWVVVHADVYDTIGPPSPRTAKLFYSTDNQNSWTELDMVPIHRPCYESTFATSFPVPGSGAVYFYVRADDTTSFASQSPYNAGDIWPPPDNLLAKLANEPTGDAINPEGPWEDLTSAYVGYSRDYLYTLITNNYNSWPLYQFPVPWFIYTVGVGSRQMPHGDTFGFGLTHANVVGLFTTGLGIRNRYTNEFSRIGDIDYLAQGNRLYMRCPTAEFTSRPEFGPWPNRNGALRVGAGIASFFTLINWNVTDVTDTCSFYCLGTPSFQVGSNHAPVISYGRVVPSVGPPGTEFLFQVRYDDQDSNLPVLHAVAVDAETLELNPSHRRYGDGVVFSRRQTGFAAGYHRFQFVFDDGMNRVTTALDSFRVTGVGVEENRASTNAALQAAPNPFNRRTRLFGIGGRIAIRNSIGRIVRRILMPKEPAGVAWDGRDDQGQALPAGIYFADLSPDGFAHRLQLAKLGQ